MSVRPLVRKADWESALSAYLSKVRDRPYAPGAHDCMLHPAAAIKAVTGRDWGRGHRGKYDSPLGAKRYLKGLGFDSPEAMLDSLLPEKPVGFAQRGDIVLSDGIPGVCVGDEAAFVGLDAEEGREGLIMRPRALWSKAWAV